MEYVSVVIWIQSLLPRGKQGKASHVGSGSATISMKLGSSQEAYGAGGEGSRGGVGGPSAISISSVMQDLKEKFKTDEEDQRAFEVVPEAALRWRH